MGDLFFFAKMIVMSCLFILLLQVKVGEHSLEDRTLDFVYNSAVTQPLHEIASGGVVVLRELIGKLTGSIKTEFSSAIKSENMPGRRSLGISLERSKRFLKEKAAKVKRAADELVGQERTALEQEMKDETY